MDAVASEYQQFKRAFKIGDTHFYCYVYFSDDFDSALESEVDKITEAFIKEFFTCKMLTDYKLHINENLVNVTILLEHNKKSMPKHCPWDYLLFVSKLRNLMSSAVETEDPSTSHQIQKADPAAKPRCQTQVSCETNNPCPRNDQTSSTVTGSIKEKPITEVSESVEVDDEPTLQIDESVQFDKPNSNLDNAHESPQPSSNDVAVDTNSAQPTMSVVTAAVPQNGSTVSSNVENTVPDKETNSSENKENLRHVPVENVGAVPDSNVLIGNKLKKSSPVKTLTKLSTLLATNNDNHPFDNYFEFMKETGDWLNNNEVQLVVDSQELSDSSPSTQQEEEGVVSTENNSVEIPENMASDGKVDKISDKTSPAVTNSNKILPLECVSEEDTSDDEKSSQMSQNSSDTGIKTNRKRKHRKAKDVWNRKSGRLRQE